MLDVDARGLGKRYGRSGGAVDLVAKGGGPDGSWALSSQILTSSGHKRTSAQIAAFVQHYCPAVMQPPSIPAGLGGHKVAAPPDVMAAFEACRAQAGRTFRLLVTYQPSAHFWPLQWLELGVFSTLALLCAAGCYWWATRRI